MTQDPFIRLKMNTVSDNSPDQIISEVDSNSRINISIVENTETMRAVIENSDLRENSKSKLGPQFIEGIDADLVILVLETGLIAIESGRYAKLAKNHLISLWKENRGEVEQINLNEIIDEVKHLEE